MRLPRPLYTSYDLPLVELLSDPKTAAARGVGKGMILDWPPVAQTVEGLVILKAGSR